MLICSVLIMTLSGCKVTAFLPNFKIYNNVFIFTIIQISQIQAPSSFTIAVKSDQSSTLKPRISRTEFLNQLTFFQHKNGLEKACHVTAFRKVDTALGIVKTTRTQHLVDFKIRVVIRLAIIFTESGYTHVEGYRKHVTQL